MNINLFKSIQSLWDGRTNIGLYLDCQSNQDSWSRYSPYRPESGKDNSPVAESLPNLIPVSCLPSSTDSRDWSRTGPLVAADLLCVATQSKNCVWIYRNKLPTVWDFRCKIDTLHVLIYITGMHVYSRIHMVKHFWDQPLVCTEPGILTALLC